MRILRRSCSQTLVKMFPVHLIICFETTLGKHLSAWLPIIRSLDFECDLLQINQLRGNCLCFAFVAISRANCVPLVINFISAIRYHDNSTPVAIFSSAKYVLCSSSISKAFLVWLFSLSSLANIVFRIFFVKLSFALFA